MIAYLDTSSLVKLVIDEPGSEEVAQLWRVADVLTSSALAAVEGRAALAAARRGGRLTAGQHRRSVNELASYLDDLLVIAASDPVLADAAELADLEALRGYDAVHLASALSVGADVMSSADADLCAAAHRQGLNIANPIGPG